MLGDEEGDFLRHGDRLGFSLLQDDGDTHFKLRWLDGHRETPAEARDQAFFHAGDLFRVGVAGDDDLLVRLDQRIESVEELLLGAALVGEELYVVDQQQVERVVVALEFVEGFLLIGAHHVGHVLLGVDVTDACLRPPVGDLVADGLHEVRLAQADAAIDEQRVVRDTGVFRDLDRCSARKLVGLAGDEAVERKTAVQARAVLHRGLGGSDHLAQRTLRVAEHVGLLRRHAVDQQVLEHLEHQVLELDVTRVDERNLEAVQIEVSAVRTGEDAGGSVVVGMDVRHHQPAQALAAEECKRRMNELQ